MTSTETTPHATDPWGAHASTYDQLFAPLTGYIARSMLALADARLPEDGQVLDIACGSGALLLPMIERATLRRARGGDDFVVGCDFSPGMVALAQHKATRRFEVDAFRCDIENGQALSYEDASFDAAFSCFGIFLFDDREAGWSEAARVLKPGGFFATTTWMAPEQNEMLRAQFEPILAALPLRLTESMKPPGWRMVAEPKQLRAEVEAAGFRDVEVQPFRTSFILPSTTAAWNALLDNPAGGALLRQCTDAEREVVRESFCKGMRRYATADHHPITLEASCNILTARRNS